MHAELADFLAAGLYVVGLFGSLACFLSGHLCGQAGLLCPSQTFHVHTHTHTLMLAHAAVEPRL